VASAAEELAEASVSVEGIEEGVLDGEGAAVLGIQLAAALGLANVAPVGGAVGGALEAVPLDEGLEQQGAVAVVLFPVGGELLGEGAEDTGGEVGGGDPREDQEAGVVDDEGEVSQALLGSPAEEVVARSAFPWFGTATVPTRPPATRRVLAALTRPSVVGEADRCRCRRWAEARAASRPVPGVAWPPDPTCPCGDRRVVASSAGRRPVGTTRRGCTRGAS